MKKITQKLILVALLFTTNFLFAVDHYWVGGTGNWSNTAHWSTTSGGAGGAAAPTTSDNVFFDSNSGTGYCTIDAGTIQYCLSLDCNGAANMAIQGQTSAQLTVYGNINISGIGSFILLGVLNLNYSTSIATHNITTGGKILDVGRLDLFHGTYSLQDNLSGPGAIKTYYGTFNTNNFNVTCNSLSQVFSNTSIIYNLGSSIIECKTGNFDISNTTNLSTINTGTSLIKFSGSVAQSLSTGSLAITFHDIQSTNASGTLTIQSTGSGVNSFASINVAGTGIINEQLTTDTILVETGKTLTIGSTGSVTFNNNGYLASKTAGSVATISKASGNLCLNGGGSNVISIKDITATGGATFNAGTSSVDLGNNTGVNFASCTSVDVSNKENEVGIFRVIENPVSNNNLELSCYSKTSSKANIEIINILGVKVISKEIQTVNGNNKINISTSGLLAGQYFVRFSNNNNTKIEKIIIN